MTYGFRALHLMVNGQKWADIRLDLLKDSDFEISAEPPLVDALTHEMAALIMRYDIDSISEKIPFFLDVISTWCRSTKETNEREINEECELNGSLARIKLVGDYPRQQIYNYYHGTTLVGELDFDDVYRIQWRNRPVGWQALQATWRRV